MNNISLGDNLTRLRQSSSALQADLDSVIVAVTEQRRKLVRAVNESERDADFSKFDREQLQAFLDKPYLLQKMSGPAEQWRLIVPRFYGFQGGWLDHHEGNYSVYIVSRFAHLLSPVPDWVATELEFSQPQFDAQLTDNVLIVTAGDAAAVFEKLGGSTKIARRDGNKLYLRPASRFEILRRILREGILPFTPAPVAPDDLRPAEIAITDKRPAFSLRPHQRKTYEQFLSLGSALLVPKPQTGKTFVCLQALAELKGQKLIMAPSNQLLLQWKERCSLFLTPRAAAEIEYLNYRSGHKVLKRKHNYGLVIFDEAHGVPADTAMEVAASIQTKYRIGPSATPFREDGNHELMMVLCGFPIGTDWPIADAARPKVTVWLCENEARKIAHAAWLCQQPADGKTLVYTQRIAVGDKLATRLKVPFFHGNNQKDFARLRNLDLAIVSSIADQGISFDVRRIVEVDFLFGSRMQAGQRLGRLMNIQIGQTKPGEHHILMTHFEYKQYGKRLLAYESWGLDIDIRVAGR